MDAIRVALIGCGGISRVHVDALIKLEGVRLVSVCDLIEERARERAAQAGGCAYTLNWQDYVADPNIDVVHICTPHYLHAPMAIALLKAGKRVLTEKPMASEVADAEEMIRVSDGRLGVVFQNRYNQSTQYIKQAVDDGRFGKLLGLRGSVFWHRTPEYYTSSGWRGAWATEGGGVLINQSIHTLDLLLYLGGKAVSVKGSASCDLLYDTIEVEDTAHCLLRFESGIHASFYATNTYCADMPVEVEAKFERATLHLFAETLLQVIDGKAELICSSAAQGEKAYWGTGHAALIRDFYKAVRENRPFWIDGVSALPALKALKGVYESSKTGKPVLL